jgi:cytochrome c-type biogenesis protein CcsB
MIVATGLLAQFIVVLLRFLNGRAAGAVDLPPVIRAASDISPAPGGWQPLVNRWFPTGTVLLAVLLAGYCAIPPKTSEEEMQIHEFGKLPIMYQGRMKPYDSLARNSMRFLSDRQTCIDPEGNRQPAIRWLLEVISGSPRADEYEVFRIASLEVIDALGLERRKGFRYAFDEFKPKLHELHEPSELISKKHRDDVPLSMYERQLEKFLRKIQMYQKLRHSWRLPKRDLDGLKQIEEVEQALRLENDATNSTLPRALPPEATETQWKPFVTESTRNWIKYIAADRGIQTPAELSEAFVDDYKNDLASKEEKTTLTDEQSKILSDKLTGAIQRLLIVENEKGEPSITKLDEPDPAAQAMISMLYAYTDDDTETFNAELKNFRAAISEDEKFKSMLPTSSSGSWFKPVTDFEANFNHAEPFFWFAVLYFLGFLMATFSWLGWSRPLNKAAFSLIAVTLIFHTLALICRIYISGRPPVTNLYSSAVFIGWGAVIFGLVMERKFRIGVGNVIAGVAGCATLIIAHLIALEKDTILVLSAVLDTQFWLATHVVCITLGYTATFVAGILGIIFVIGGVFTTALSKKIDTISVEGIPVKVNGQTLDKVLGRMIYGSLCFAIFFSFVGTVLGGLWADDSWGRFWGWDPKENGALVIVLWNAIILHSRWGGFAKSRGIAVLAMGGNIVTSFSWFGVNQLGIGLHSYGQAENVLMALGVFTLAQLALIGVGCLPKSLWASYAEQQRAKEAEAFRRSKRKST